MTELSERNSSDPINIHEYHRLRDELNDLVHSVSFWKNQCERMEITISKLRHECEILREKNIETFRGRLEAEWNRLQQEKEEYSRSVRLLRVEKENLANNVDARLRELMEAYRNEIDGDLERYRTEAENAKEALSALREEIQREDLSAGLIAQLALSDTRISDMEGKGKDPYPTHFLLTCPEVNHALAAMARDLVDSIPRSMKEDPNVVEVYYLHRIKVGLSDVLKCFSQYLQLEKHRFGEQLNECEHEKQKLIQQNHVLSLLHDRELKGMMAKHETDLKMWKCDMTAMNSALHISINKDQDSLQSLSTNYYRNQFHLTHRKLEELNSRFEIEKERMIQMCIIMKGTLVRQQEEFEHAILKKADELVACQTNIISRLRVRLHELECERKKHTCSSCNVSVNVSDEIKQSAEHLNSTMGNISSKYVSNTAESVNSMWGLRRFHLNDAVMMKTQELFRKYKNYVPSNLNLQENF